MRLLGSKALSNARKSMSALSGIRKGRRLPWLTGYDQAPLLRKYLLEHFAAEVEELKDAMFVGLGP